jgi:lysine 2,3-aminomutase
MIRTTEELSRHVCLDKSALERVSRIYPMRISRYFLDLMLEKGPALRKQVIPDIQELDDPMGLVDPLAEDSNSPVPNLTHRYPDRVLFLVSGECAVYCRFCTRKRKIGRWPEMSPQLIEAGLEYIRSRKEIRDVLVSGGDPLMLPPDHLDEILARLRAIPHVQILRIGTRVPIADPARVTPRLVRILKKYPPLYINIHVNHPEEIAPLSVEACQRMIEGGMPLGSQSVLLRGINDRPEIIMELMRRLLAIRIRPYYLLQADLTRGTGHFRTRIETGLKIMDHLRGRLSGIGIPVYVVDLPGGGGKVPVLPQYMVSMDKSEAVFTNYQGKRYRYPQPVQESGNTLQVL